jgi:GAF domain-containing protein
LDVQATQPAAFDEANAIVLQSMADQIAIALNNAEQFTQTERQAQLQAGLTSLTRDLFAAPNMAELYRALADGLGRLIPHDYLSLTLVHSGGTSLREYLLQANADQVLSEGPVWSTTNTLSGRAFTTRQPALSDKLTQEVDHADAAHLARAGFQSALCLPLLVGERVLGTLNFASVKAQTYSLENPAPLEQIAGQVAVALENQRLAQAQQKSLQEMEALTRQLTGQAWAKQRQRLGQQVESIQYVRSGLSAGRSTVLPEIEAAIAQRTPIARSERGGSDNASPYEATLAIPSTLRGEVLGALQVGEANQAREWTEEDLTFMQAVADQVALALDNARLIEETERRAQRERLVAEISSRMFAANDLETIVQIAGVELGRALHVKQTLVRVRSELDEQPDDHRPDRQLDQQA